MLKQASSLDPVSSGDLPTQIGGANQQVGQLPFAFGLTEQAKQFFRCLGIPWFQFEQLLEDLNPRLGTCILGHGKVTPQAGEGIRDRQDLLVVQEPTQVKPGHGRINIRQHPRKESVPHGIIGPQHEQSLESLTGQLFMPQGPAQQTQCTAELQFILKLLAPAGQCIQSFREQLIVTRRFCNGPKSSPWLQILRCQLGSPLQRLNRSHPVPQTLQLKLGHLQHQWSPLKFRARQINLPGQNIHGFLEAAGLAQQGLQSLKRHPVRWHKRLELLKHRDCLPWLIQPIHKQIRQLTKHICPLNLVLKPLQTHLQVLLQRKRIICVAVHVDQTVQGF